jgi:hypothetical protein
MSRDKNNRKGDCYIMKCPQYPKLNIDGIDGDGIYGFKEGTGEEKGDKGFLVFFVECVSE